MSHYMCDHGMTAISLVVLVLSVFFLHAVNAARGDWQKVAVGLTLTIAVALAVATQKMFPTHE